MCILKWFTKWLCENLVTIIALIWFFPRVYSKMACHIYFFSKILSTFVTCIWFLSSVSSKMSWYKYFSSKIFFTLVVCIWFRPSMCSNMIGKKCYFVDGCFVTLVSLICFPQVCVYKCLVSFLFLNSFSNCRHEYDISEVTDTVVHQYVFSNDLPNDLVKSLSQLLHWYGFSPVCIL